MVGLSAPSEAARVLLRRQASEPSGSSTSPSPSPSASTSTTSSSIPSTSSSPSASNSSSSASQNDTRVVLGRGFSNGQLTYTVPVTIADQSLNLQLDTGSGDLWVANTGCTTASCNGREGIKVVKFDDNVDVVVDQNTSFSISYLQGGASGAIKTSSILLGDPATSRLAVNSQAFASANSVTAEDLDTGNFSGVIGIGLPALSLIQASLNDTSDVAASNDDIAPPKTGAVLAGIWRRLKQGRRFVGLGMQRLEEDGGRGDSVLTVGSHDPAYAGTDLSQIVYTPVVPDDDGVSRHWRVYLTQMTVQRGSTIDSIPLGASSVLASGYPAATFDTAASVNLGPASTLNALYGAWNIGPASDGGYYVPCDLQMNITLTLGGVSVPIHPLDASLYSSSGVGTATSNSACIGSFQALRSLSSSSSDDVSNLAADFVLSPAFMRSAYTVFTCDDPDAMADSQTSGPVEPCQPQVGLRPLVNMTEATNQFAQVRVQKQTLGDSGLTGSPDSEGSGSKGLSGGVKIVIGCIGAIVGIVLIFGVALWRLRKRRRMIAARRAAALAAAGEKSSLHRGDSGRGPPNGQGHKMDGPLVPMALFAKDDDDDDDDNSSGKRALSPAQRAKVRQLQQMHGVFDDELAAEDEDNDPEKAAAGPVARWRDDPRSRDASANAGTAGGLQAGTTSWDISSTGYIDARKVKNEYLGKLNDEDRQIFASAPLDSNAAHDQDEAPQTGRSDSFRTLDRLSSSHDHKQHRSDSPSPLLGSTDRQ